MSEQLDFHFVGGRRRYNAQRQRDRAKRRHEVARLLEQGMNQAAIALQRQVSKSVVCRDVKAIASMWGRERCAYCRRWFQNFMGQASPQCNAIGRPKKRRPGPFWP